MYVQALIEAKDHKSHNYRHDLRTPLPLERVVFCLTFLKGKIT